MTKVRKKNCYPNFLVEYVSDDICGNFVIPCGSSEVVIWKAPEARPSGTVSVYYSRGCADNLIVTIVKACGKKEKLMIPPKNTRSRTIVDIVEVRVECSGNLPGPSCDGVFCISLHYPLSLKH